MSLEIEASIFSGTDNKSENMFRQYIIIIIGNFIFFSAMEIASFGIGSQRTDDTVKDAKDKLVISMNAALGINPSEMCLVGTEEVSDNWFNLTFEIPNKKGLLDKLRWAAIYKEPWLGLCGVKSVAIGNESQILLQPVTRSLSLTIQAGELSNEKI